MARLLMAFCTHVSVYDFIPVQVLQPQAELPEILSRLVEVKRWLSVGVVFTNVNRHEHPAWHVLEHQEEGISIGDRDGLVQVHNLLLSGT